MFSFSVTGSGKGDGVWNGVKMAGVLLSRLGVSINRRDALETIFQIQIHFDYILIQMNFFYVIITIQ